MRTLALLCAFAAIAPMLAGCSGPATSIANPDDHVTIQQGVYGSTTHHDDVGDHPETSLPNFAVLVFDHLPARDAAATAPTFTTEKPLAETKSDASGFYQIALEPKKYVFCSTFGRCVSLEIRAHERKRLDYSFSVGPGWSTGEPLVPK